MNLFKGSDCIVTYDLSVHLCIINKHSKRKNKQNKNKQIDNNNIKISLTVFCRSKYLFINTNVFFLKKKMKKEGKIEKQLRLHNVP